MLYNFKKYVIIEVYKYKKGCATFMKRNVLKKFEKSNKKVNNSYGMYVFLICGVLIATIAFICSQNSEANTVNAEGKVTTPTITVINKEEAENSKIGYIEKEIDMPKEYFSGMSARIAHLDEQYVVQATITEKATTSKEDTSLLEKVVYAESRGEPEDGKIAVVNVILNRKEAPEEVYPNSISEVVFDTRFNTIQFECAGNNEIWAGSRVVTQDDITEDIQDAVEKAISGENPIGDRTNFHRYNPETCNHKDQIVIGNHVFY